METVYLRLIGSDLINARIKFSNQYILSLQYIIVSFVSFCFEEQLMLIDVNWMIMTTMMRMMEMEMEMMVAVLLLLWLKCSFAV